MVSHVLVPMNGHHPVLDHICVPVCRRRPRLSPSSPFVAVVAAVVVAVVVVVVAVVVVVVAVAVAVVVAVAVAVVVPVSDLVS
jgi:hypothetical protein